MNIENLIKYLNENNLSENLLRKILYIDTIDYKKILKKSIHADWLDQVELHFFRTYYINGQEFFKNDMSALYDEWNYIGTISLSPVKFNTKLTLTQTELEDLLRNLPIEKLEALMNTIGLADSDTQTILQEKVSNIRKQNEIEKLTQSINEMKVSLYTMIALMGDKIEQVDVQNINKIIEKANEHIEELKQENKNQTLRLK